MRSLLGFFIVMIVKVFSHLFYRLELKWLTPFSKDNWDKIRVVVVLNHTSLYEPLFSQALPPKFIWRFVHKMVAPAADKTFNRPIVGTFWKMMIPHASSISRKRDESWDQFMDRVSEDSLIVIAPEGRMKRPNGLDKDGKPMTVRGGIADIIAKLDSGLILMAYSGGLHHVQSPGEHFPRFFKTIKMNIETIDIAEYKKSMPTEVRAFKLKLVEDFQHRLETKCP
ncbi:MAG: 1-acyl-sn-glycerol-3-phosphate acyltransferase [Bacteriovoracaceae bacterium]|nr:1-acyl-sn-glycerol-3-phosphate acyltransferase [Bacteriovoracaceae bacterium]